MARRLFLFLFYLLFFNNHEVESQRSHQISHYRSPQFTENTGLKQLSLDFQAEYFDYLVKVLPNGKEESQQCSIKKVSTEQFATLKITESMELNETDLIKCEIKNIVYERKPILVMHTSSTTSESSEVTKFSNPRKGNCFSFRVQAKGIAEIYLYNELSIIRNNTMVASRYIVVTLGAHKNTKSFMRDPFGTCNDCRTVSTSGILDSDEFRGFWISWNNDKVTVGKEDKDELFSNTFYENIGDIQYIGLSTAGNVGHGTWKIMEPFCPTTLEQSNKERTFTTKCHKIFDKTMLNSLNISTERKLLKKIEALVAEYNTEILLVTVNNIKNYYFKNLDELYINEYMHILKICKTKNCDETTIDMIQEKLDDFRKVLQNKLKSLITTNCSTNEHYDLNLEKCICNSGYIKNGNICERGALVKTQQYLEPSLYGDEDIEKSVKPFTNQYRTKESRESSSKELESTTENDLKELYSSFEYSDEDKEKKNENDINTLNCANLLLPKNDRVKRCTLERDFMIPYNYDDNKLEIIFLQNSSEDIYKLTWNNLEYPTFKLNKLKNLSDKADDIQSSWYKTTNALWVKNSPKKFKFDNYRLSIQYEVNKLQIRIDDAKSEIFNSYTISVGDFKYGTIINKLCSTSYSLQWLSSGEHNCV